MAEQEINTEIIKHTQAALGKYVKKPVLSEKLLKRPPFRFLFDVVTAVIRDTGCFAGLYTAEELNYDNIKDREDKMKFLQKMIDVIKITTAQSLYVRASKIVSGHEPEKTNELLALIGEVIDKKLDWQSAVQQLLKSNGSDDVERQTRQKLAKEKSVDKTKDSQQLKEKVKVINKTKEKEKPVKQTKSIKPTSTSKKEAKVKEDLKEKLQRKASKEHTELESKEKIKIRRGSKDVADKTKEMKSVQKQESNEVLKNDLKSSKTEIQSQASSTQHKVDTNSTLVPEEARRPAEELTKNIADSPKQTETSKSSGKSRHSSGKVKAEFKTQDSLLNSLNNLESLNTLNDAIEIENKPVEKEEILELAIHTTPVARKKSAEPTGIVKRESTFTRENSLENSSTNVRPRTSLRPPSARPASARPGAPRRRDKNVEIILQPNEPVNVAGINVTLDAFNDLDDDGENLVVIEDASQLDSGIGTQESNQNIQVMNEQLEQQGHLVQQILETQKELVQQTEENMQKKPNERINSATLTQSSARQVNTLRDIIQNLTKSINPLGKVLDFVPEDIDAMQLELNMWHDAYLQAAQELKREKSLIEETTEPLKHQLSHIDESIKEYVEIINSSRIRIIQNSEKIYKLLTGSK